MPIPRNFKRRIEASFLANANSYEQLVCYLIIRRASESEGNDQIEFTKEEVSVLLDAEIKNISPEIKNSAYELNSLIENLQASAVIEKAAGTTYKYKFRVPQLINYIKNLDLEYEIKKIMESIELHDIFEDSEESENQSTFLRP